MLDRSKKDKTTILPSFLFVNTKTTILPFQRKCIEHVY